MTGVINVVYTTWDELCSRPLITIHDLSALRLNQYLVAMAIPHSEDGLLRRGKIVRVGARVTITTDKTEIIFVQDKMGPGWQTDDVRQFLWNLPRPYAAAGYGLKSDGSPAKYFSLVPLDRLDLIKFSDTEEPLPAWEREMLQAAVHLPGDDSVS